MKLSETTATSWAASIPQDGHVEWDQLQTAALAGYPPANRHRGLLSVQLPGQLSPGRAMLRRVVISVVVVVVLLVVLSPIAGVVAALLAPEGRGRYSTRSVSANPDAYLPIASVSFALTLIGIVVFTLHWWRDGRAKGNGFRWYTALSAGLAALSVGVTAGVASDESTPHWRAWEGVIVAAAVVSVVSLAIQLLASKRGAAGADAKLTRLQRNVKELTAAQRAAIRQDLSAAIDDLACRGIVSEADAARARGAELGRLIEVMGGNP